MAWLIMQSAKTEIIESIFNARWNEKTRQLNKTMVTLRDVATAIHSFNEKNPTADMSARNPANFFKDLTRIRDRANSNWPASVFKRGFTARQMTGGGLCFEFIPISKG